MKETGFEKPSDIASQERGGKPPRLVNGHTEDIAAEERSFWRKHWERFKERAKELLGKSPELPPVAIEIFYTPHSSAEDLKSFLNDKGCGERNYRA